MNEQFPLFAFGTLRRGEVNHHFLAGQYERVFEARLPGYAIVSPLMIDCSTGSSVSGELFFLRSGTYEKTLAGCDELEGVTPRLSRYAEYQRKKVRVLTNIGPFDAWAYVKPERGYRFAKV